FTYYTIFLHFFYLTFSHPPNPTLFPYTTLFRSQRPLKSVKSRRILYLQSRGTLFKTIQQFLFHFPPYPIPVSVNTSLHQMQARRSEEHTSELQSRGHLVCRLLLEKKKKQ